ncbi:MAG: phosphotransferase family protein [Planctomycetota bacterium]|jgi:aminoglycoside phosphotransferase (APT) family kinase protein
MITEEQVIDAVKFHISDFSEENSEVIPIPTGHFNKSCFVNSNSHQLVIRIAPSAGTRQLFYEKDMMRQEMEIHECVKQHTSIPVPAIHIFDDSSHFFADNFIIMERLPGEALSSVVKVDCSEVLQQVGRYLAEAHGIRGAKYGYTGSHTPMPVQDNWADAFAVMWEKLILDISETGIYSADLCRKLIALQQSRRALFEHNPSASLLHMDVWPQNILVDAHSRVTGLIDWDRSLRGDPELEFAVLDYCSISEPDFWAGYGKERDNSDAAQLRKVFYLLYEVQKYIVIEYGRRKNPAKATSYAEHALKTARQYFGLKI